MASLFKIKEEDEVAQNSVTTNQVAALPSIEDLNNDNDNFGIQNNSESDNSSSDEKAEETMFTTLETMAHNSQNIDSENANFDLLDDNFTIKFEDTGTPQTSAPIKAKSIKRRKSEEAREEAKRKKELEEEEREKMQ